MMYNIEQFSEIGDRKEQEDYIHIIKNSRVSNWVFDIIGVYDGHNGIEVLNYLKYNLEEILNNFQIDNFYEYIYKVFEHIEKHLMVKQYKSGCCINLIFLNRLQGLNYIVTLGDVQTIIKNKKKIKITPIHDFDNALELSRFKSSEIKIIKDIKMYMGLQMSRTFGDYDIKKIEKDKILAEPSIYSFSNYEEIYIYTDGVKLKTISEDFKYNISSIDTLKQFINNSADYKYKDNYTFVKIIKFK